MEVREQYGRYGPVECFWGNCAEAITTLPPCAPAGVLEADAVGNLVLLASHVAP